jgi:hypothetical protein
MTDDQIDEEIAKLEAEKASQDAPKTDPKLKAIKKKSPEQLALEDFLYTKRESGTNYAEVHGYEVS